MAASDDTLTPADESGNGTGADTLTPADPADLHHPGGPGTPPPKRKTTAETPPPKVRNEESNKVVHLSRLIFSSQTTCQLY